MRKHIDASHKHNEQKKPVTEKCALYKSTCIEFKSRINKAMPLAVGLDISLGEVSRRGYSRDPGGLIMFCFFSWLQDIWVCSVCENPSSSTPMIYIMFCMYVRHNCPDWEQAPKAYSKMKNGHSHTHTHTQSNSKGQEGSGHWRPLKTEKQGGSPHPRCGPMG